MAESRSVYAARSSRCSTGSEQLRLGKGKVYKSSDAKALVKRYVDWPASIKAFDEDDNAYNAPNGAVDTEDWGPNHYPNQIGPGTVNGKDFLNRLKMPTEEAPPK